MRQWREHIVPLRSGGTIGGPEPGQGGNDDEIGAVSRAGVGQPCRCARRDQVVPLIGWGTTTDLIEGAISRGVSVAELAAAERAGASEAPRSYADLDVPPAAGRAHLISPIAAPEIWACGVTYRRSADFREGDMQTGKGIYDMVYDAARPEIFSKGGDSRCVGPNAAATIRTDSAITVPEAELAYVLGANGEIVGYTICDDVSAWDIERENPLYLPQSKIFYGCTVLGPVLVTSDELTDPYSLEVRCVIERRSRSSSTSQSGRTGSSGGSMS